MAFKKKEEPPPPAGPYVVVPRSEMARLQQLPWAQLLALGEAGKYGTRVSPNGPLSQPKVEGSPLVPHPDWLDWGAIALFRSLDKPNGHIAGLYKQTW